MLKILFRSLTCQKTQDLQDLLESHKLYKNPNSIRHGIQLMRNAILVMALICLVGIYWKKKRMFIPPRRQSQFNVITLNQTVLLVILINIDSMVSTLLTPSEDRLFFVMELLRIIFIENVFFKCLIPVYLLHCACHRYTLLWVDRNPRQLEFFMTAPSYIARPVISKYQSNHHNYLPEQQVKEMSSLRNTTQNAGHIVITIHAPEDQGCSLPQIEI